MTIASLAGPPTRALANTVASLSFGTANLISYADSDFEGTTGDWVKVNNSGLSLDTTEAYLHNDSLEAVVKNDPAIYGPAQWKLGNAQQINVKSGFQYRIGAYFKIPAVSGRTITWSAAFFDGSNNFLQWVSAPAVNLTSSGSWQYVTSVITAPPPRPTCLAHRG